MSKIVEDAEAMEITVAVMIAVEVDTVEIVVVMAVAAEEDTVTEEATMVIEAVEANLGNQEESTETTQENLDP